MPVTIQQLGPKDMDALRALLMRDPAHNLLLLGLLEEFGILPQPGPSGFAFWGRFDERGLTAAVFVGGAGGMVAPSASDGASAAGLAEALAGAVKLKGATGERAAVDALVRTLCRSKVRLTRSYRLYHVSADDMGPFTNPQLRLAREEDLPRLVPLAAAAVRELMERDPLVEDPEHFRSRVLQRIRARRTYVLEEQGEFVFKVDVGSRSQHGAELEGVYTLPSQRRRGHATLSLGQISRHLLSSLPRLVVRVDERDESTARLVRKVGYVPGRLQRLVLAE